MTDVIISVHDLQKTYHIGKAKVEALRGVDLEIQRGEFLSIMGPSGSGKSTLLHILGGLTQATAGFVHVGGKNLQAVTEGERTLLRRHTVGFVFQKCNLIHNLTAAKNIRLAQYLAGNESDSSSWLQHLADILGIKDRLTHKPAKLSDGEQQRVALARALVNQPAILLADEPTGNLDTANAEVVLRILRDLNRTLRQTVLMITHNREAAAYGDRTITMRDGRTVT
jgi:putative ABC transport system ATP-binding protein